MSINWEELASQYNTSFVEPGKYKVKVSKVDVKDKSRTGSCAVDIEFAKKDGSTYPKARYYLSFKEGAKVGFRQFQHMSIMRELCKSAEKAQQTIESIEGKDSEDAIIKAYKETYAKLGGLGNEVEIEVYEQESNDGRVFTHSQLLGDGPLRTKSSQSKKAEPAPTPLGGEEVDLDSIPF